MCVLMSAMVVAGLPQVLTRELDEHVGARGKCHAAL